MTSLDGFGGVVDVVRRSWDCACGVNCECVDFVNELFAVFFEVCGPGNVGAACQSWFLGRPEDFFRSCFSTVLTN